MKATLRHAHERRQPSREGGPAAEASDLSPRALQVAATLSAVAALIHLWALPEHWAEWWGYGAFFLLMAGFQGFYAVVLLSRPGQLLLSVGIWSNLGIIVLYVVSRTSGIPIGPHGRHIDPVGALDMVATIAELGLVAALVTLLSGRLRRRTTDALLLVGCALWVLRLTGILQ